MHYTLHQLTVFIEVVRNKSITKAAEKLFLTQPAVSIQLKKFQDQFSVPLTEVIGRQLFVTDFGNEIAVAAEYILEKVDEINYKTEIYKNQLAGRLKLSVVSTGKYVMPFFLSKFMSTHVGVELMMDVTNKTSVLKSLENNEVDFALVSVLPDSLKLNSISLSPNHLCLVGRSDLVLEKNKKDLLANIPLIYRESGSATRKAMESFISSQKVSTRKKIELTSNEAVKQAVIAGLGLSIMPLIGLKNELRNNEVKIIDFKGLPITTQWYLVWLKDKKLSPVSSAFQEYINANKDEISKNKFGWVRDHI